MSDQKYQEMLDSTPEFVDAEPPSPTTLYRIIYCLDQLVEAPNKEESVVEIKGTEAEDKLLQWTGQQRRSV